MNLDKKINEIKFFLKNSEEHYGKEIEYILVNPKSKDVYILCADELLGNFPFQVQFQPAV